MLMIPATYGCFQVSNAWAASVCPRPKLKRAVALALNNSMGNTALVWTPYLYPASAGPKYTVAWSVNLALCVVAIVGSLVLRIILQRANRSLDREYGTVDARFSVSDAKVEDGVAQTEEIEVGKEGQKVATVENVLSRERATWRFQI